MPLNIPARRSSQAEPPLQLALDAAQLGTWHWDAATDELTWDASMRRIFGLTAQVRPSTAMWLELIHPQDREDSAGLRSAAMREGGRFERRYRILRPDGEVRWVEALGQVTTGPDGRANGTIGCARDITAQVRGVEDLKAALGEQDRLLRLWQAAVQRTTALQAVTADLAGALTVGEVTQLVGSHMRRSIGAANGAVAVVDDDPRYLRMQAWFGYSDEAVEAFDRHPVAAATPLAHAVRTGTPVYVQAHEIPVLFPALVSASSSATLAALPLTVAGQVMGGLALGFAEPQVVDDEQRTFFELLAGQVAQAVDRSLLVERMRTVTHDLQSELTPGRIPVVDGLDAAVRYSPGGAEVEEVGGDWFDVVALPDGRAAVVVGDVMGRGVRAATAMTRYRAQLRAFVSIDADPNAVVARLDRLVAAQGFLDDDLVTLVYGVIDPATREFRYVNAGHPAPLVVRPDGCLPPTGAPGPPIALTPGSVGLRDGLDSRDHPRTCETVRLATDELLLLYTDGLVERSWRDPDVGVALLVEGLSRTAPDQRRTAEGLVTATSRLDLGEAAKDDVTLLAIRCTTQSRGPRTARDAITS